MHPSRARNLRDESATKAIKALSEPSTVNMYDISNLLDLKFSSNRKRSERSELKTVPSKALFVNASAHICNEFILTCILLENKKPATKPIECRVVARKARRKDKREALIEAGKLAKKYTEEMKCEVPGKSDEAMKENKAITREMATEESEMRNKKLLEVVPIAGVEEDDNNMEEGYFTADEGYGDTCGRDRSMLKHSLFTRVAAVVSGTNL
ncbi:uncharacterized protein RSE6_12674 [Rhynchosporium secalis]|uniref:Uncharacterized protein n=1 Tax=Rhynchosporium secalis TaxID=38038 RepID=A0A1E1MQZ4_RHYSE|nr:uncharacterized protein RSE6_12674 [Rhynchosporium secalis]